MIFKSLSYCFKETTEFDVRALLTSRPLSRLIRWYNKRILGKGYLVPWDVLWIENYKLKWRLWCIIYYYVFLIFIFIYVYFPSSCIYGYSSMVRNKSNCRFLLLYDNLCRGYINWSRYTLTHYNIWCHTLTHVAKYSSSYRGGVN